MNARPPSSPSRRGSLLLRIAFAACAALALALGTRVALAAEPPPGKSVAVYAEGTSADTVRAALTAVLSPHLRVLDPQAFAEALRREGLRLPVGPGLTKGGTRKGNISRIRNAATATGADAVVVARGITISGRLAISLLWIDPRSPDPAVDKDLALTGDDAANQAAIAGALGTPMDALVASTAPPAVPTGPNAQPQVAVAPAPVAPPPPSDDRLPRRFATTGIVIAQLGVDLGGRRFTYHDGVTGNLPDYHVLGVPMPSVGVELYPAAMTKVPFVRDLGLTFRFAHAFGLGSDTNSGTKVDTSWNHLRGGLRARFRPGGPSGAMIGVSGGLDFVSFDYTAKGDLAKLVPSVKYLALRAGLDGRIPFWHLALLLDAGYDGPLSAGAVADRFRGTNVGGVDLGVGLAVVLPAGFELRLRGEYARYFYKFHPIPGDEFVAGGALDELLNFGLGVSYAY